LPSERAKLDKISAILRKYDERDILVGGHTALAGRAEFRGPLSEQRAAAVAGYFVAEGVRPAHRIITRGYGASRPVAGNDTEEGKRKNRRVEITIMEN
jgi:outer membrane protein OmpA-like peptidoglycan-associated protein